MAGYINFLKKKSRFKAWLLVFFLLLATIPLLLISNQIFFAKLLGVIFVTLISIALWRWRTQTVRDIVRVSRIKMTLNEKFWLDRHIPFYYNLSKSDKKIFEDRIGLFLAEIRITEIDKEVPEKDVCLYVASAAIIAYWGLPYWNYGELSEVLVYPDNFTDENTISSTGTVIGKVHHGGLMDSTMILSLKALIQGFKTPKDGQNVGIHEFSHLLDKGDGVLDGAPCMMNQKNKTIWFALLNDEIKNSRERKSDIDSYGVPDKVEFFAVLMEYYREKPETLKKNHPLLFDYLSSFFVNNMD